MTPDQINKAVAEELGWKSIRDEPAIWEPTQCGIAPGDSESSRRQVPDFCEDHNAVAEMRKAIQEQDQKLFIVTLIFAIWGADDLDSGTTFGVLNATPRQQAEAFLKMRGKWVA